MNYCTECGLKLGIGDKFCGNCGQNIVKFREFDEITQSSLRSLADTEKVFHDVKKIIDIWQKLYQGRGKLDVVTMNQEHTKILRDIMYKTQREIDIYLSNNNTDVSEWFDINSILNQVDSLIKPTKGEQNESYSIAGSSLLHRFNALEVAYYTLRKKTNETPPLKKSYEESEKTTNGDDLGNEQLIVENINETVDQYNIFLEDLLYQEDLENSKDYVLVSFFADKYEINFSCLNEITANYLSSQSREFIADLYRTDLDDLVNENSDKGFSGHYVQTGIVINETYNEKLFTKNIKDHKINFNRLEERKPNITLGQYFLNQLGSQDATHYLVELTSAPAEMAIIFFLKEEVSLEDVNKRLQRITVNNELVGFSFDGIEYPLSLGWVDNITYYDRFVMSIKELEEANELGLSSYR
jgi:hypothetical protein